MRLFYRKAKEDNTLKRGSIIQPLEKQFIPNEYNGLIFSKTNPIKNIKKNIPFEGNYRDFPYKNIVKTKVIFNYNMADIMIHNRANCSSCGK
jgi:hypothetical protein